MSSIRPYTRIDDTRGHGSTATYRWCGLIVALLVLMFIILKMSRKVIQGDSHVKAELSRFPSRQCEKLVFWTCLKCSCANFKELPETFLQNRRAYYG